MKGHTHCPYVSSEVVIGKESLLSHVKLGSRHGVGVILLLQPLGGAKVGNLDLSLAVAERVWELNVAVKDS